MMDTHSDQTREPGDSRTHQREPSRDDDVAAWGGDVESARRGRGSADLLNEEPADRDGYRGRHSQGGRDVPVARPPGGPETRGSARYDDGSRGSGQGDTDLRDPGSARYDGGASRGSGRDSSGRDGSGRDSSGRDSSGRDGSGRDSSGRDGSARGDGAPRGGGADRPDDAGQSRPTEAPIARRTATGWRVGDEEVSDLTSAMVLADLLAADMPAEGPPTPGSPAAAEQARATDVRQLQETVAQLEHALTVRVRVEQAIGVLAERHRLRPRQAFELLRSAARSRGRRVLEVAGEVVDSATNPLLRIPEELAKPPAGRRRGRMSRRGYGDE